MTSTASITICAYSIPHLSHDQAERRDPAALSYFRIIHRRAFYIIRITLIFEGENKQIDSLYEALDEMSRLFNLNDEEEAKKGWTKWFKGAKTSGIPALVRFAERIAYGYRDEDYFFSLIQIISISSASAQILRKT